MDTASTPHIRLTGEELLARARKIAPMLRERAADCAASRRISAETMEALHDADLFAALKPKRFGGHEIELIDFVRIVEELSRQCGSTGWVYSVLTSHAVWVASFAEEAQREVWDGEDRALACSAFMPTAVAVPEKGGYRVSGKWPFASGCDFAKWALLGALEDPKGPTPTFWATLIPMSELAIVDDWQVLGLAGTGSKTLTGEGIFVPAHRVVRLKDASNGNTPGGALHDGPLFKCPRYSCSPYTLLAPLLGIAQGAVDDFCAVTGAKVSMGKRVAEFEGMQLKVAESDAEVDAARLMMHRNCRENIATMRRDGALTLLQRARNRRDQAFATRLCRSAVDRLHAASGAHGLYESSRVQRAFRDAHAAAAHFAFNWEMAAKPYGQLRLGVDIDPNDAFLL